MRFYFSNVTISSYVIVMAFLFNLIAVTTQSQTFKFPLKLSSKTVDEAVLERRLAEDGRPTTMNSVMEEAILRGSPGEGYYLEMAVGTPPQVIDALVDTGSSNYAIAAAPNIDIDKYFNTSASSTLKDLNTEVSVPYTQGDWMGFLGQDVVRISQNENTSVIANVAFITQSDRFFINGSHWEGILGLAYQDIARPNANVEPFFDSLVRQTNCTDIFSLQLCGLKRIASDFGMVGNLVFGGIDESLYTGTMQYVPIYKEWYYEVVITDIAVGMTSLQMDCKEYNFDKSIVDSGTTNLRLPTRVYEKLVYSIIEQTLVLDLIPSSFWDGIDLLCWTHGKMPWGKFPNVIISLAASHNSSIDLVISPRNYLRPIDNYDYISSSDSSECYKFSVAVSESGTVIGAVIMEGFYTVFDRSEKRLGFAKTACFSSDAESFSSYVDGPHFTEGDNFDCAYVKFESHASILNIATYVMGGICLVCIIPLVLLALRWQILRCKQQCSDVEQRDLIENQEER